VLSDAFSESDDCLSEDNEESKLTTRGCCIGEHCPSQNRLPPEAEDPAAGLDSKVWAMKIAAKIELRDAFNSVEFLQLKKGTVRFLPKKARTMLSELSDKVLSKESKDDMVLIGLKDAFLRTRR